MKTLILEVRDRATFIPVMALKLEAVTLRDSSLLAQGGWGRHPEGYIMLARLDGSLSVPSSFDPRSWGNRTLQTAHKYIEKNFNELTSGDVIDVEYILGETDTKKEPQ